LKKTLSLYVTILTEWANQNPAEEGLVIKAEKETINITNSDYDTDSIEEIFFLPVQNDVYVIAIIILAIVFICVLLVVLYKRFFHNFTHALGGSPYVDSDSEGESRGQQDGDGKPIQNPVPGRRCPACLERGDTVWVIPGKCCPQCGTPVN
jgi:hypothetical protein